MRSSTRQQHQRDADQLFPELADLPPVLTSSQVREFLNCARSTVNELLLGRKLFGFQIGTSWRIPKSALIDFVTNSSNRKG